MRLFHGAARGPETGGPALDDGGGQVRTDKDSAKYWLNLAAEQGHMVAKKTYNGLFVVIPRLRNDSSIMRTLK